MKVKILSKRIYNDLEGNPGGRHANIIISDDVIHYQLDIGGLPLEGELHPILEARFDELWSVAEQNSQLTTREVRRLIYNSGIGGGWTADEFQEAMIEALDDKPEKLNALRVRRQAIRQDWLL